MPYLMLFQIGPVQSFIAAARRTQDLYVGSRLLSDLAEVGVRKAMGRGMTMLFPVTKSDGTLPNSVPHRFSGIVDADPETVANSVESAIQGRWRQHAELVKTWFVHQVNDDSWVTVFDRQIESWLEFYWVAVDYDRHNHGHSYRTADQAMAARKAARHFTQVEEKGWKCTLTGATSALPLGRDGNNRRLMLQAWGRLSERFDGVVLRPNEMLGAVATVKRFLDRAYKSIPEHDRPSFLVDVEGFPSTRHIAGIGNDQDSISGEKMVDAYFAVLHMDGDRMGEKLSHLTSIDQHQAFSQALAEFADENVPDIIAHYDRNPNVDPKEEARAAIVYAGGDDVLALLPLRAVLTCADEIRRQYGYKLDGIIADPTMSAGVAITPENFPLDEALRIAREAEHTAKEHHKRNSVVVTEAHGTALRRSAGAKWELTDDESIARLMDDLMSAFSKNTQSMSTKLGYDLQDIAYSLDTAMVPAGAREDELRRVLTRRVSSFLEPARVRPTVDALAPRMFAWGEHPNVGWDGLANWVILARFLASEGRKTT